MIQRMQSVWLFLAALLNGALFISPLYKYQSAEASDNLLSANNFYPLMIIAAVITFMPLMTIFLFKNRKKQIRMIVVSILATISFIAVMMMRISSIKKGLPEPINDQYLIPGSLLPVVAILFMIVAIRGVNKDEKLVKSMDRLR